MENSVQTQYSKTLSVDKSACDVTHLSFIGSLSSFYFVSIDSIDY